MFCPSSDCSDDTIHNGFDEDQMEAIAKLLQDTVTADERFPVDFYVQEKLTLSTKEESDSLMELESDMRRIDPAISASVEGNIPEIKRKLQEKFEEIYQNQEETPETNVTRFLVTVENLIKLKGSRCTYVTDSSICGKTLEFEWDTQESVLLLQWKCSDNHFGYWDSDEILCSRRSNKVYSLSLILPTSVLFSGNNYAKIKLFADMLGMKFISHTLFSQTQRLYCAQVIKDYWENAAENPGSLERSVSVVMGAMIPQGIAQSKLIYFLSPRGCFSGCLCNKKVKGLKNKKIECDRFLDKECDYYTQSISANTHDSYCYNLECKQHSFYLLPPPPPPPTPNRPLPH